MAVELRKGQKVSLAKKPEASGEILINLNWNPSVRKTGFLFTKTETLDLDLGCLFEMTDGRKGCVQALGKAFGSLQNPPYIALDKDDRSGNSTDGENLRINGAKLSEIKRVLVYTFIYEGAPSWKEASGVVTLKCPGNDDLIVRMDEYSTSQKMCAIAMIENNGGTLSVEKLIRFFDSYSPMDRAFGWGMNWTPGRK